jgi:nucleotide-binding universal stress UspA family protein
MSLIASILYPVDFSPSCVAMAAYVKRAAALLGARVSLIHVVDPTGFNGMQLYVRPISEVEEEYLGIGREKLDSFLAAEFPVEQCPRILASGDAATEIARVAREERFDLIIMPTHSGIFRQMLLGSTTAKIINDADCPVLTSRHAQTIAPRPLEHREWLCAIGFELKFGKSASFCQSSGGTSTRQALDHSRGARRGSGSADSTRLAGRSPFWRRTGSESAHRRSPEDGRYGCSGPHCSRFNQRGAA